MATQAALGSDIALAFDECTPYHADRDYTARSTERTHRWLDRCLDWHAAHGPRAQAVFGIVQGGVYEDLRRESAARGRLGRGRRDRDRRHPRPRQARDVRRCSASPRRCFRSTPRSTCSGSASPTTCSTGIAPGIDLFDCAVPTRLARHGTALANLPGVPVSLRPRTLAVRRRRRPAGRRLPVRDLPRPHPRLPALPGPRRARPTAAKLLTVHNLAFLERLVGRSEGGDRRRRVRRLQGRVLGGAAPWAAPSSLTAATAYARG